MSVQQTSSLIAFLIYSSASLFASNAHAITLSQQPLFLTEGAEANIMFVLDDSGSMAYEVTPEKYRFIDTANAVYVFPPTNNVYKNGTTHNGEAVAPGHWFDSRNRPQHNVYGKLLRSKINRAYYDPAKRYIPWVDTNGSRMPNADPVCAWHNPMRTIASKTDQRYCRDLINSTNSKLDRTFGGRTANWKVCAAEGDCSTNKDSSITYYPATYYWFSGTTSADEWKNDSYASREIKSSTSSYSGDGRGSLRTDCMIDANTKVATCTYDQEIQNFANWYTYYRSRALLARAGIGEAFAAQQDDIRVGFGSINTGASVIDGETTNVIQLGVRKFDGAHKARFLNALYDGKIDGGTPLRSALDAVGTYYQRTDNEGPWGKVPGTDDLSPQVACRASYAVLMTDGYWDNRTLVSNIGQQDGTDGNEIINDRQGGTPAKYKYVAETPFSGSQQDTLADVAMKYWKNDLHGDLDNKVKPNEVDEAFWQHMTTFTVGLGVIGKLPEMNVPEVIKNKIPKTWPTVTINSTTDDGKVDDLIHAAVNGRGDFFSAQEPEEFSNRMSSMLRDINARNRNNAAAAAANSTSLTSGSVIYRASFDSTDWSGRLIAREIKPDGTYGVEHWQASIPAPGNRNIFTYSGTQGISFLWANLTDALKGNLQAGNSAAIGEARLNWVRGVNNTVPNDAADLRERSNMLGDIVNSSPVFAGRNNMNFDRLPVALGGDKYKAYYEEIKKNRREIVYVGANDGMLHAFDATMSSADAKKDGEEVFAYIPSTLISGFKNLASESYGKSNTNLHRYMVDGQIFISDAYIGNRWRNLLVGTLGAGGRGLYVLDVTDPNNFGTANVLFELTESKYRQLGFITGTPFIAPGKDNRWKIYLGNGYKSTQDGIDKGYLGIIDIEDEINKVPASTSKTKFIPTDSTGLNALSQPALLSDPKGYIVAAYAGDLHGNLWKYNLSGGAPTDWLLGSKLLFTAKNRNGNTQPITSSPTLGFNTLLTPSSVMIYFGTGRYIASTDNLPLSQIQSFYAIADKDVQINSDRSTLHEKTISPSSTATKRVIAGEVTADKKNAVDWENKDGWFLDFIANERVVVKPQLYYDRLIFPTVLPSDDPCSSGGTSWVMELIGVGNTDLEYTLLGQSANTFESVLILAEPMMLAGVKQRAKTSTSSASSSSSSSENQCESGTMVNVMTNIIDESRDKSGTRPCPLFNRQAWRELENR